MNDLNSQESSSKFCLTSNDSSAPPALYPQNSGNFLGNAVHGRVKASSFTTPDHAFEPASGSGDVYNAAENVISMQVDALSLDSPKKPSWPPGFASTPGSRSSDLFNTGFAVMPGSGDALKAQSNVLSSQDNAPYHLFNRSENVLLPLVRTVSHVGPTAQNGTSGFAVMPGSGDVLNTPNKVLFLQDNAPCDLFNRPGKDFLPQVNTASYSGPTAQHETSGFAVMPGSGEFYQAPGNVVILQDNVQSPGGFVAPNAGSSSEFVSDSGDVFHSSVSVVSHQVKASSSDVQSECAGLRGPVALLSSLQSFSVAQSLVSGRKRYRKKKRAPRSRSGVPKCRGCSRTAIKIVNTGSHMMTTPCGHVFCHSCSLRMRSSSAYMDMSLCPTCGLSFENSTMRKVSFY